MAVFQLTHRLLGISAICLAAILLPVTPVQRALVLTAFSLGIGLASVKPDYDRAAARLIGPAVLVLAVVPVSGFWGIVALLAIGVVGLASFSRTGMSRSVPALGLPIMTFMFRSGHDVSRTVFLAWVAALILTIVVGAQAGLAPNGPRLGDPEEAPDAARFASGRRRALLTIGLLSIIAPVSILLARGVDRAWPDAFGPPPRAGDRGGPAREAHPGLRGGLDTGAPVDLRDDVVLRVRADEAMYWRGTTYADWDGRTWTRDVEPLTVSWSDEEVDLGSVWDEAEGALAADLPEPIMVTQHFKTEQAGLDVILGAWRMETLRTAERGAEVADDGSVSTIGPLGAGATWTVQSVLVPASADDLRRADPTRLPAEHPLLVRYGREDDVMPQVADLALAITAEAGSTYDKVLALEDWMDANVNYTRDIDQLAPGSDAVQHLLFHSRRGFCEQIGSAMVVMLRSLGVPARLVVGYVPSEYDATTGEWLSRGTDAHAWAEVYFPGVGWQGFDPTAGVPLVSAESSGTLDKGDGLVRWSGVALIVIAGAAGVRRFDLFDRFGGLFRTTSTTAGQARIQPLRDRLDHCGRILDRPWHGAMTIREKGQDLVLVGVDRETVRSVVRGFEHLLFFAIDHQESHDRDLDDLDVAIAKLEAEVGRLHSDSSVETAPLGSA